MALSLANKTGPDALAAASLQLSRFNRRSPGHCSRLSAYQVTRAQARGAGTAGNCSPRTWRQEAGRAAGRRSASFRSPRTLKGLLRAISWAPWLPELDTGLRGGASSVEPSDIYGSPHAAAALSTRATQDQQSGEDPESGVRASGVEADRGEGSCRIPPPTHTHGSPDERGARLRTLPVLACSGYYVSGVSGPRQPVSRARQ